MNIRRIFQIRFHSWADWLVLSLFSLAASWIAAFIHSLHVFYTDFRLYNAQIGGSYFGHGGALGSILACSIPAIPTFLILLPFRRRQFYFWTVWICFVVLWTWCYFESEVAYK